MFWLIGFLSYVIFFYRGLGVVGFIFYGINLKDFLVL